MLSNEIGSHKISNADNSLPFWIYLKNKGRGSAGNYPKRGKKHYGTKFDFIKLIYKKMKTLYFRKQYKSNLKKYIFDLTLDGNYKSIDFKKGLHLPF